MQTTIKFSEVDEVHLNDIISHFALKYKFGLDAGEISCFLVVYNVFYGN